MNKKVDVWSMGVILYLLTYGKLPLQHIKNQMKKMYVICDPNQKEITFSPTNNAKLDDTLKVRTVSYSLLFVLIQKTLLT